MKKLLLGAFVIGLSNVNAQDSTKVPATEKVNPLQISGYIDAYYAYYTDSVGTGNFQKFPTMSPRSNSFGLNVAMITAKYSADKIRGILSLHYGDIALSSWSSTYNFIQEANVGVQLHKKLWLDAGLFRTHVGTEGLFAKENIASSIAIGTFNEPYYQAGAKLSFTPTEKLSLCLHVLNGYNIFEDNNDKKSLGLLVNYAVNDALNFGYSNYYGDDSPSTDSINHARFYNNLYVNYTKNKIKIQIGGDYATQQNADTTGKKSAMMYSGVASLRYQLFSKIGIYGRGEIFNDPAGFLGGQMTDKTGKTTGLKLWGATLGIEYKPTDNSYIRLEGRQLQCDANQEIFRWNGNNQSSRLEVMLHFGVSF